MRSSALRQVGDRVGAAPGWRSPSCARAADMKGAGPRMARGRAGRFARLALPCLLLALASHPAQAQVYIPPPDDLIEELPVLPPDVDPVLPAPAPPPPSASNAMSAEEAKAEARSTGSALR